MLSYLVFGAVAFVAIGLRHVRAVCKSLEITPYGIVDLTFNDASSEKSARKASIFDEPTKFLSVVIPAYCEEARLPNTLKEIVHYLQKRRDRVGPHFTYEVVIVDDGSSDGTAGVASKAIKEHGMDSVRVLTLPRNCGKGYAVKQGMLRARGALCLMMDADGATVMSEVETLEAALRAIARPPRTLAAQGTLGGSAAPAGGTPAGKKLVLDPKSWDYSLSLGKQVGAAFGSRAHLQEAALAKRHWYRNILTHGFHLLVSMVAGSDVKDTQCGFKLFTRRAAGMVFKNQRLRRWCFDVEIVHLAHMLSIPISEVHVRWTEMPGSKIRFWHIAHMAWELLLIKLGYSSMLGGWQVAGETDLYKKTD